MTLNSLVDRFRAYSRSLIWVVKRTLIDITALLAARQNKLHSCDSTWLCCNSVEGSDHSRLLRLTMHFHNSTLYPVQLRSSGS